MRLKQRVYSLEAELREEKKTTAIAKGAMKKIAKIANSLSPSDGYSEQVIREEEKSAVVYDDPISDSSSVVSYQS